MLDKPIDKVETNANFLKIGAKVAFVRVLSAIVWGQCQHQTDRNLIICKIKPLI